MDQNLLRQRAIDAIDAVEYMPRVGTRAAAADDRNASRVVPLAPTHVGNADSGAASACRCDESILDAARRAPRRKALRRGRRRRVVDAIRSKTYLPAGFVCPNCGGDALRKGEEHRRHLVRVGRHASRRARTRRLPWPSDLRARRRRSISRLVPQLADHRGRDQGTRALSPRYEERLGERRARPRDVEIARHRHRRARCDGPLGRRRAAPVGRSVESIDDVRFGPNVVEQVGRVYRNLRNRMRFMLSNLDDLRAVDVVARERDGAARPARLRRHRRVRRPTLRAAYDRCQISRRLSAHRRVRKRDVEPLLRRAERSALLARRRRSAPAQRAIGAALRARALPHGARAGALVYGRRGVASVSRPHCAATPRASSIRRSTCARHRAAPSRTIFGSGSRCANCARASPRREPARFRSAASSGRDARAVPTPRMRSATTCARRSSSRSCTSLRARTIRARWHRRVRARAGATARSARDAGSIASSEPIRSIRRSVPTACKSCVPLRQTSGSRWRAPNVAHAPASIAARASRMSELTKYTLW